MEKKNSRVPGIFLQEGTWQVQAEILESSGQSETYRRAAHGVTESPARRLQDRDGATDLCWCPGSSPAQSHTSPAASAPGEGAYQERKPGESLSKSGDAGTSGKGLHLVLSTYSLFKSTGPVRI